MKLKLSDAQQYFLQIMVNRKVIDQFAFKTVFKEVLNKFHIECSEAEFKGFYTKFLQDINQVIRHFNLELKMIFCEITAMTYFALICQCDTVQANNLSNLYSAMELNIFRKCLELIIESENGYVGFTILSNEIIDMFEALASEAATQSQTTKVPSNIDIRQVIEKFLQDCWLIEVIKMPNMITLHSRALAELSQYIKDLYKDNDVLNYCYICKNLLLISGIECSDCQKKLHRFCAKNMLKKSKDCPSCRKTFAQDDVNSMLAIIDETRSVQSGESNLKNE